MKEMHCQKQYPKRVLKRSRGQILSILICLLFISTSCYCQNVCGYGKVLENRNDTLIVEAQGFAFFALSDGVCSFVFSQEEKLEEEIKKSTSLKYILFNGNDFLDYFNVFQYVDTVNLIKSKIKLASNKKCDNGDDISYYKCTVKFVITKKQIKSKQSNYLKFCLTSCKKSNQLVSMFKLTDPTLHVLEFTLQKLDNH